MGYLRKLADLPRNPPVTTIAVIVCIALFVLVNRDAAGDSQAALESAGWRDAHAIWDGQWWPLATTAFLHYEVWHLAFNIYWLWVLGGRLELIIGSKKFLAFILGAAFFSSAMQLAFSSNTGIGFSGVGYAIFGLMWFSRATHPEFSAALSPGTCQLFIVWMFGCMFMTWAGDVRIGNAAHFSGLVFGVIASPLLTRPGWRRPAMTALTLCLLFAAVTLVWAPWNSDWLGYQGYRAHMKGEYQQAIDLYAAALSRDSRSDWLRENLELARQALEENDRADSPLPE